MQSTFNQDTAREYVGGNFDQIGAWQFDYITATPEFHKRKRFLDLACGNLRLGKHMIPHLNKHRYVGVDCNQPLIDMGVEHEVTLTILEKKPKLYCVQNFEMDFAPVEYVWSNSLFSHLTSVDIQICFERLTAVTTPDATFYFTFFCGERRINPEQSHARKDFYYTFEQMETFAHAGGWNITEAEIQSHPRGQRICRAEKI